ncbi:LacI family transcriptional regulator [Lentilactobacillus fungorum]|uniref:LacI family transcriptional regulator n=1 Tax=Lentilactobacillus fungorum TaxID=2201250 RepID=A0ABQ3W2Q8_9LACO|nr:LacI family DNA-binding transcriptional regulator [Lentilactobacillus fungorum]GHP13929.1 LacI family transcriptional regulator [Lentilactobacillus fungorum]
MKRATISDVSRMSGVSISTVSRVLNGNYPVKKETKEKVLKVIKELHFNRSNSARNLRTNKSNLVALVVADINNSYYSQIAKLIDDELFDQNYNLLVCNTDDSVHKETKLIHVLIEKGVDAMAISSTSLNPKNVKEAMNAGIHVVLLDRDLGVKGAPFVGNANFDEAKALTEYLVRKGHENIAFVSGTKGSVTSRDRFFGYRAALIENNLVSREEGVIPADYRQEIAYQRVKEFLKKNSQSGDPYTAIFSANNLMTIGVIQAANEMGLRIPEDISVVSFGQLDAQEIISPKVTCIKQDIRRIAIESRKKLISLADGSGEEVKSTVVPGKLVVGDSVLDLSKNKS